MEIATTRFGRLEIDASRIIDFPSGLLGFPSKRRWALIQAGEQDFFFWFQSLDQPDLAFVVTDPQIFRHEFSVYPEMLGESDLAGLRMLGLDPELSSLQSFVICNKLGDRLTANFAGPLLVDVERRLARQVVRRDGRWSTREKILDLDSTAV